MTPESLMIQSMLDEQARLSNAGLKDSHEYQAVVFNIKQLRGEVYPRCWGEDDCSTHILSMCPWRVDCGPKE